MELSHVDEQGNARMVDVSGKAATEREAVATGRVDMKPDTLKMIAEGRMPKGDVFSTARIAGIMAAKRTWDLIPMCHQIPLDAVKVELEGSPEGSCVEIKATVRCTWKTGVEMEALTAVSVACLTVYDMCKAVDKDMVIGGISLAMKKGGKSGTYLAGGLATGTAAGTAAGTATGTAAGTAAGTATGTATGTVLPAKY